MSKLKINFVGVQKFNPYHDKLGRFASSNGYATFAPGKSEAGKKAIAREKERYASIAGIKDFGDTDTSDRGVNDSLGKHTTADGKLTPERAALHKKIVKQVLAGVEKAPEGEKTFIMMGGGPASGKSTMVKSGAVDMPDKKHAVYVDSDFIKGCLPEYQKMVKSGDTKAAAYCHEESSALAKRIMKVALDNGYTVVLDGTGDGGEASLSKKLIQAKAAGAKTRGVYATVDTQEAINRSNKRAEKTGRLVPEEHIREIHSNVSKALPKCAAQFDEVVLYDTSTKTPKLLATGGSGKGLTAVDQKGLDAFLAKANDVTKSFVFKANDHTPSKRYVQIIQAAIDGVPIGNIKPELNASEIKMYKQSAKIKDKYIVDIPMDVDMLAPEYDKLYEGMDDNVSVNKSSDMLKIKFTNVEKFNPYHDRLGRFASGSNYASFTIRTRDPKKQHMADMAVAREKERNNGAGVAGGGTNNGEYGLSQEQHSKLENLVNSAPFAAAKYRKEIGMSDEDYSKFKEKYYSKEKVQANRKEAERKEREKAEQEKAAMDERVKNELPGLNQQTIEAANNVSFFNHGSVAAREALRRVDAYKERNKISDDMTDEQKAYLKQREAEYKQLITDYYNDSNSRYANNPHSMVTGPANFNTRAYNKKLNAAMNKQNEYEEKLKRFEDNTNKKLKSMESEDKQISYWRNGKWKNGETIDAADPLATKKLQAKLDYHKETQQKMKDANAYYKKNGTMSGFSGFNESTNTKIDNAMNDYKARGYSQSKPFESYQLTNNNASIKSTEKRLKDLESRKAKADSNTGGTSFNGGSIIRNAEANRLQLKFDSIPDAATRQQLKSSGWRWSPKNGVWQRQLTENAERSAKQITESLNKSFNSNLLKIKFH